MNTDQLQFGLLSNFSEIQGNSSRMTQDASREDHFENVLKEVSEKKVSPHGSERPDEKASEPKPSVSPKERNQADSRREKVEMNNSKEENLSGVSREANREMDSKTASAHPNKNETKETEGLESANTQVEGALNEADLNEPSLNLMSFGDDLIAVANQEVALDMETGIDTEDALEIISQSNAKKAETILNILGKESGLEKANSILNMDGSLMSEESAESILPQTSKGGEVVSALLDKNASSDPKSGQVAEIVASKGMEQAGLSSDKTIKEVQTDKNPKNTQLVSGLENQGEEAKTKTVAQGNGKVVASEGDSASKKVEFQSALKETPGEMKMAETEKPSANNANKAFDSDGKQSSLASKVAMNAGDNNSEAKSFTSNNSAQTAHLETGADKGTAKTDFQSFIPQEGNAAQGAKASPSTGAQVDVSAAVNEARAMNASQAASLNKAEANANMNLKTHEVFERSVVDQIVSKASLVNRNGQQEMRIQLDPPSLGTVKIQVSVNGNKVNTSMVADNSIARDIIERNMGQLRNSFSDQGFKVDQMSVNVGNDPRQQAADYERPFFMDREFSSLNSDGNEEGLKAESVLSSRTESSYAESGKLSVFA